MSLYALLGVKPTATGEEIREAYLRRVRRAHPDLGGDKATFQAIQEAYEVLGDAGEREKYDAGRLTWDCHVFSWNFLAVSLASELGPKAFLRDVWRPELAAPTRGAEAQRCQAASRN